MSRAEFWAYVRVVLFILFLIVVVRIVASLDESSRVSVSPPPVVYVEKGIHQSEFTRVITNDNY